MPGIGFWHMDGCNMDDLFAFAYYHETIESWERDQADYRELSEQMDQQWDLAKEWGLPSEYSEPSSHFSDVWRLIVKDATGEIPLGKRLNKVAHSVVSLVVQLRIAAKHDACLVVDQLIEALMSGYAPLRQACEESTDQELSGTVQPNVTRLLAVLDKLTTHLESYLSESEEDESADDSEADFSPQPPRGFRWRKVLHVGQELRHILLSFTDIAEETPNDGWYADDVPF